MKIVRNRQGKQVGIITINKTYTSPRNSKKHYMLKFGGYGISEEILLRLAKENVNNIVLRIEDKDEELLFSVTQYLLSNLEWNDGADKQLFVRECDAK